MKQWFHRAISTAAIVTIVLGAAPVTQAQVIATPQFVRGAFGRDASATGMDNIQATGFNAVTVTPLNTTDLATIERKGMKAVVWLWDYNNKTCTFRKDNAFVRYHVTRLANNSAVVAYHIADEPNANRCPTAPAQLKARTDLIRSIDPDTPTMIALTIGTNAEWYPYQRYVGSADILGLVVYPCTWKHGCRFGMIATAIREAKADGVDRFWAIMQDFGKPKNWYMQPSPAELQQQFDAWATSGMEGYMLYHWGYGELDSQPLHLSVLAQQNVRSFAADTAAPSTPVNVQVTWNAPSLAISWSPSTDDAGVTGYRIYEDGKQIASVGADTLKWTNKWPVWNPHTYHVTALDAAGNISGPSSLATTSK